MELDLDALASHQTIKITTTGRRTGMPRRVEIWWFNVDGRFIITGTPGRRDWLANLNANPNLTIHVQGRDIPATATPVRDVVFRRKVFTRPQTMWYSSQAELDHLVETAPMVEIHFVG
ncbi:MAG TPA: nitroreductase family deazaflavin-dependent oxidoreductase [Acidimicrobiia bacterium]|nr:nitroreductase family deazaflavin-dependent oxidoreductase [Acidimicrobiia bacterium]